MWEQVSVRIITLYVRDERLQYRISFEFEILLICNLRDRYAKTSMGVPYGYRTTKELRDIAAIILTSY